MKKFSGAIFVLAGTIAILVATGTSDFQDRFPDGAVHHPWPLAVAGFAGVACVYLGFRLLGWFQR